MHDEDLDLILPFQQVDEIVNVGSSAAFRSNLTANDEEKELLRGPTAGNTRMLKLYLTDGRQQV